MGLLEGFLFIMAYGVWLSLRLINVFALIYDVPTKALRWIGGQAESYGEEQSAEQVKGKISAGGEAAGRASSAAGAKGSEHMGAINKHAEQEEAKTARTKRKVLKLHPARNKRKT